MGKIKNVIFDFDGTVADTSEGIIETLRYSLEQIIGSSDQFNHETLSKFIGPALTKSYMEITGLSAEQTARAIACYRQKYKQGAMYKSKTYDGNIEIFQILKKRGVKISIASSKPQEQLEKIIERLDLSQYFDIIAGALDDINSDKASVIRRGMLDSNAVMVGDSIYDILGAKAVGIPCIGVGFGFGDNDEMKGYAPAYFANSVQQLKEILLQITE